MNRYLFAACCLATLAAIGVGMAVSLRRSPAVQASADEPVPYWPASDPTVQDIMAAVMCTRCSLRPSGICTCPRGWCGHPACQFDQAVLTGLTRDELDMLDGKRGLSL